MIGSVLSADVNVYRMPEGNLGGAGWDGFINDTDMDDKYCRSGI